MGNSNSAEEKNFANAMLFASRLSEINRIAEEVQQVGVSLQDISQSTSGVQVVGPCIYFVICVENARSAAEKMLPKLQTELAKDFKVKDIVKTFHETKKFNFHQLALYLKNIKTQCFLLYPDCSELKIQVEEAKNIIKAISDLHKSSQPLVELVGRDSGTMEECPRVRAKSAILRALERIFRIESQMADLPELEPSAKRIDFLSKGIVKMYTDLMCRYVYQQRKLGEQSIRKIDLLHDAGALASLRSTDQSRLSSRSATIKDKCFQIVKILAPFESLSVDARELKEYAKRMSSAAPSCKLIGTVKKKLETFQKKVQAECSDWKSDEEITKTLIELSESVGNVRQSHCDFLEEVEHLEDHIQFLCKNLKNEASEIDRQIEEYGEAFQSIPRTQEYVRLTGVSMLNYNSGPFNAKELKALWKKKSTCNKATRLFENCLESIKEMAASSRGTCNAAIRVSNGYNSLLEDSVDVC